MGSTERLIVFGGAVIEKGSDGTWLTKAPFREYLKELATYYEEVVFVTTIHHGPPLMSGRLDFDGISILPIGSRSTLPLVWIRLLKLSNGADCIFHLPSSIVLFPIFPVLRMTARRLACYLSAEFYEMARHSRFAQLPLGRRIFLLAHEYPLRVADLVFARGRYLAQIGLRFNENVVETVPIGYMRQAKRVPEFTILPLSPKRVLFVGKVQESKGITVLLRGFHEFCKRNSTLPCILDVVGDGPQMQKLKSEVEMLGLECKVRIHGYVDGYSEMDAFWNTADLLVMPSIEPEGVPRVIDEAFLHGIPVIATRVGGVAAEFSDGELILINPDDPLEIADAMAKVFFDEKLRMDLILSGRARSQRWSAEGSAAAQHINNIQRIT